VSHISVELRSSGELNMERPVQVMASEQTKPALLVSGLRKSFGARVAVDSVGFTIAAGEVYGLLGPNGAGKTTSISMIAGILARDTGEITIDGIDIDAGPAARALIGIVPQAITLYLDLTARQNLDFWGRRYDLNGAPLHDAIEGALDGSHAARRRHRRHLFGRDAETLESRVRNSASTEAPDPG
jgi:ABC-type multidrug transport system ATPase subunit